MNRPTPSGDCAALGAEVIARIECGNYGEESLVGWKFPDGRVVLERGPRRWLLAATDTLQVSSAAWGNLSMAGAETLLMLSTVEGEQTELSHFEFSAAWGGPTDDAVAKLARAIASEAGCAVTVIPMTFPPEADPAPPVPAPAPAPAPPPKPRLQSPPGATVLATLETLTALELADGTVTIQNAATGEHWAITRDHVLVITPYAVGGQPKGVWTLLERRPTMGPSDRGLPNAEKIAGFYCWEDDRKGVDEATVTAFATKVATTASCEIDHRATVWD